MKRNRWLCISTAFLLLLLGCGPRVLVPPEIDLKQYEMIGLIEFGSDAEGNLAEYVTQEFLEAITKDQKEVRIIELGNEAEVLEVIQKEKMDPEAIQAIGEKYQLKTIITGYLRVSDVKPEASLSHIFTHLSVSAKVKAWLSAKLLETERGATIWTGSDSDEETVAHVSIYEGGGIFFDAEDPEEAYGDLVRSLVKKVSKDFRVSYKRI